MNKAKKVKVNENGNMIRNCKYESGTEIEPYIYDGKLTIKGVGWQNSGGVFYSGWRRWKTVLHE